MKKFENGKYVNLTESEINTIANFEEDFKKSDEYKEIRIYELKQNLSDTDYIACKIAEGVATAEEYSEMIGQRQAWRNEINRLEGLQSGDN